MAALIDNYRQYVKKEELPEFYKTIEESSQVTALSTLTISTRTPLS